MKKFPIALQLYSVRDEMEKDFEGTMKRVAKMGYQGVEFAGAFSRSAEEIKKLCKKLKLVPVSAHIGVDDLLKEGTIAFWSEVGLKYIAIPWLGEEYRPGHEKYDEFKVKVAKVLEECKKYGITLSYHNHDFEFEKLGDEYLLDIMYRDLPELRVQIDTCWAQVGMGDAVNYLAKWKDRSPTVHLKDFVGSKTQNMYGLIGIEEDKNSDMPKGFELRPFGYGVQDGYFLLKASELVGAEWVIVEQDNPTMDRNSLECAEMSINYLKTING